ncbi:MAG: hypothetical protein WAQ53_08475 [Thiofilum sp.]|uniref:hypothetical protein n=1 Tax=Thiofilum sp. TaxID=2212733 RepID=UPI0025EC957E|nr:hypothetical protein [Thiofilum sp.]MBK8452862.1 hypothetical protein [Thiofilum sp.]
MQHCGLVMTILTLGQCLDQEANSNPLPVGREVALYYQTQSVNATAPCYRRPTAESSRMTQVKRGAIVTIASTTTKLIREGGEYWLEVYPPLSHRPTCYMNTRNLIPLPNPR